jgi:hypothetical protein
MENTASTARPTVAPDDPSPERLFRDTENAFARAGAGGDLYINLAGLNIRIRFVGERLLARIGATLAHLEIEPVDSVDLTICCLGA